MRGKGQFVCFILMFSFCSFIPKVTHAGDFHRVNARSAIVYDMASGKVLFEQNADEEIPPASLTKILTLYLTWEAIDSGQISLSDKVRVSRYAASMPNVRMGLRAGDTVTVAQLIRGMAIESGNDAAVAMAEYLGGTVQHFVAMMNAKAKELGMTHSCFMTPNGLPARGQLTTARDIMKVSIAYLRRFPQALAISSTRSFTYRGKTDHNPNNLLGRCPGVDGLKTGFVCASGFNISATAMRNHTRIIAVVLGSQSPGVRRADAENLIEDAYREIGGPCYAVGGYPRMATAAAPKCALAHAAKMRRTRSARRAMARRSRMVALARARHAGRKRVRVTTAGRRARLIAHARPMAPNLRERKTEARVPARTGKHARRQRTTLSRRVVKNRRVEKAAVRKKIVRASSSKPAAKARSVRSSRRKMAAHKRTRVHKAAIKKRHTRARRVRVENGRVG